jgi:hypothetical protein
MRFVVIAPGCVHIDEGPHRSVSRIDLLFRLQAVPRLAASAILAGVATRQQFCRNCVALIILNRQEDGLQEIVEDGT